MPPPFQMPSLLGRLTSLSLGHIEIQTLKLYCLKLTELSLKNIYLKSEDIEKMNSILGRLTSLSLNGIDVKTAQLSLLFNVKKLYLTRGAMHQI
jgi:hypothetical protein